MKIKVDYTKVTRNLGPVTRDYWLFKLMIMGMSGFVKGELIIIFVQSGFITLKSEHQKMHPSNQSNLTSKI